MYRKDLVELLLDRPMTLEALAELLQLSPRELEDDLRHLEKSLRHAPYRLEVLPAHCRQCGFHFRADKLRKPGKCPKCKGTWIEPPRVLVLEE